MGTNQLLPERIGKINPYRTSHSYDPVGNPLVKGEGGHLTRYSYNAANAQTLLTPPSGAPTTLSL